MVFNLSAKKVHIESFNISSGFVEIKKWKKKWKKKWQFLQFRPDFFLLYIDKHMLVHALKYSTYNALLSYGKIAFRILWKTFFLPKILLRVPTTYWLTKIFFPWKKIFFAYMWLPWQPYKQWVTYRIKEERGYFTISQKVFWVQKWNLAW